MKFLTLLIALPLISISSIAQDSSELDLEVFNSSQDASIYAQENEIESVESEFLADELDSVEPISPSNEDSWLENSVEQNTPKVEESTPEAVSTEEWERMDEPKAQNSNQQKEVPYEIVEETKKYYKVRHPQAAKGLKRITADGTYIYETQKSKTSQFIGISAGTRSMAKLINPTLGLSYEDIYKKSTSIFLDVETPFSRKFGNLNWLYGISLSFSDGQGHFANQAEAQERYSLFLVPSYLGISYHFQYSDKQWMIPYIAAGVNFVFIMESRDDGESFRSYTYGGHANAGIKFKLDGLMATDNDLDEDYGINHVWLTLDFRAIVGAEKNIDITSQSASIGIGVEM